MATLPFFHCSEGNQCGLTAYFKAALNMQKKIGIPKL
jgi:hypothetical protein